MGRQMQEQGRLSHFHVEPVKLTIFPVFFKDGYLYLLVCS